MPAWEVELQQGYRTSQPTMQALARSAVTLARAIGDPSVCPGVSVASLKSQKSAAYNVDVYRQEVAREELLRFWAEEDGVDPDDLKCFNDTA